MKSKEFWKAALVRAFRTVCQTVVASIGAAATFDEVGWLEAASAAVLAGLLSLLNAIATGLPEVND